MQQKNLSNYLKRLLALLDCYGEVRSIKQIEGKLKLIGDDFLWDIKNDIIIDFPEFNHDAKLFINLKNELIDYLRNNSLNDNDWRVYLEGDQVFLETKKFIAKSSNRKQATIVRVDK